MHKILHSFSVPCALKLTASQSKIKIICINNVIPSANLSVKLDMHFICLSARKYTVVVAWLIPSENASFCVLKIIPVRNLSRCNGFMSLYFSLCFYLATLLGAGQNGHMLPLLINFLKISTKKYQINRRFCDGV